jgi:pimeloyl-[acyl-carrier protein] methyl ester esterase
MSLHIQVTGRGADIVLLHGWAMHGGVFDEITAALSARYRVHCIDLPGHGRSEFDARITNLEQLTARIAAHVPAHAYVVGWSLGGLLAMQLAARLPLRGLALVSSTPKFVADDDWERGMPQAVFAQFSSRLQSNFAGTVEDFLRLQVRGDLNAAETFSTLKTRLLQHPPQLAALQLGLEILRDSDSRSLLSRITIPSLIVAGEHDRITHPRAAEYMATHLPHTRLCIVKRAGHAPFISHRAEFMDELTAFLAESVVA